VVAGVSIHSDDLTIVVPRRGVRAYGAEVPCYGGAVTPLTAAAACSTSSTTASACDIMTACEAPSIVTVFFDLARSAMNASRLTGMLLSRVPKMNQDGMAFQAGTGMTDENDRAVNSIEDGRYVGGIAAHAAQRVRSRDHLVSLGEQQFEDRFPVGQRLSECAMHQNYGDDL
jgi:hypothetical protein